MFLLHIKIRLSTYIIILPILIALPAFFFFENVGILKKSNFYSFYTYTNGSPNLLSCYIKPLFLEQQTCAYTYLIQYIKELQIVVNSRSCRGLYRIFLSYCPLESLKIRSSFNKLRIFDAHRGPRLLPSLSQAHLRSEYIHTTKLLRYLLE